MGSGLRQDGIAVSGFLHQAFGTYQIRGISREIGRCNDERSTDQGRVYERVIRPFILSSTAGSSATCSKNGRTILTVTSRRYNGDARATWTRSRYDHFYLFSLNKCSTKCRCMRDTTVS